MSLSVLPVAHTIFITPENLFVNFDSSINKTGGRKEPTSDKTTMTKPFETTTYVLDTSVLLANPNSLFHFPGSDLVIPLVVLKELEGKRSDPILGYNARTVLRLLEALRTSTSQDLKNPVPIGEEGSTVRIEVNHVDTSHLPEVLQKTADNDTRILSVADGLRRQGLSPVLISKDLPLRILASVIGIPAEEYVEKTTLDSGYTGMHTEYVSKSVVDALYNGEYVTLDSVDLPRNTGVILQSETSSGLAVSGKGGVLTPMGGKENNVFGVRPRSVEQRVALHHLLNEDIPVVSLGGTAGTGKSVLALAAALELVLEKQEYRRVLVFRPVVAVGHQDLGFLPGSEEEKMSPWTAAVYDALRAFTTEEVMEEVKAQRLLEILPLTHIRGRTLGPRDIVIVDETQNLERTTILTALTRLGEESRMFLLHDVSQRDNLRVGRHDGIASVVDTLKGEELFAHVTLSKSERSATAELASRLLDNPHF